MRACVSLASARRSNRREAFRDEVVRSDARLVAPAEIQIAAADGFGA
jgi:hypothetical protein